MPPKTWEEIAAHPGTPGAKLETNEFGRRREATVTRIEVTPTEVHFHLRDTATKLRGSTLWSESAELDHIAASPPPPFKVIGERRIHFHISTEGDAFLTLL